jgi:hypothetical protein
MIPHTYRNASEDPGAYDADTCPQPRQAVTAGFAWDHLIDETLWLWVSNESGLDPWLMITGMDKLVRPDRSGNVFIVEWGRTGEQKVPSDFRLFAQRIDLKRLGLAEGEPGGRFGNR